jgi:hypothetical protein
MQYLPFHQNSGLSRRAMLRRLGAGLGSIGLAGVMGQAGAFASPASGPASPPLVPPFPGKAKRIIQLFMPGGPSHVDTFDYKPDIARFEGQRPSEVDFKSLRNTKGGLLKSPFGFKPYGQCGTWVSDIFPHVGSCVDDICFIHSMHTDIPEHASGIMMMNLGALQPTRPSMGSWLVYGLGSESQDLPGFVSMCPRAEPRGGRANWGNSFLPGEYGGCHVNLGKMTPESILRDLNPSAPRTVQRQQADLLAQLNRMDLQRQEGDAGLEASIGAMEMAFRMQFAVPDAFDTTRESAETLALYGPGDFAKGCLIARRLSERGVRVVQLSISIDDYDIPWDTGHDDIAGGHQRLADSCDRGIAALLRDLKGRGLLDETLVLWGGEFGRAPTSEGVKGRDHNHYGFTTWMAGGGVKGGLSFGATDNFGMRAMENRVHVHDLHATVLHLMGLDHEKLTYRYSGRDYRLTDVSGRVIRDIMA